jgi:hypothetical protein
MRNQIKPDRVAPVSPVGQVYRCRRDQSFSCIWSPVMGSCSWLDSSLWEVSSGRRVELSLEGALQVASRRWEVAGGKRRLAQDETRVCGVATNKRDAVGPWKG